MREYDKNKERDRQRKEKEISKFSKREQKHKQDNDRYRRRREGSHSSGEDFKDIDINDMEQEQDEEAMIEQHRKQRQELLKRLGANNENEAYGSEGFSSSAPTPTATEEKKEESVEKSPCSTFGEDSLPFGNFEESINEKRKLIEGKIFFHISFIQ